MGKRLKMGAGIRPCGFNRTVSSQVKVMLAGIDTVAASLQLYLAGEPQQADLANVRATRRSGEWASPPGRACNLFISLLTLF